MVMPARTRRCICFSGRFAEGCRRHPSAYASSGRRYEHGLVGSNVNGSSLPHCSGMPDCRNLAVRAFCRWQASWAICDVDEPLGALALVVRSPADVALEVVGVAVAAVV